MTNKVIGFIGLGLMGHGMAKNILAKGFDLVVMAHRNRAPVDDLLARGAREVGSPREMTAAADAIVRLAHALHLKTVAETDVNDELRHVVLGRQRPDLQRDQIHTLGHDDRGTCLALVIA